MTTFRLNPSRTRKHLPSSLFGIGLDLPRSFVLQVKKVFLLQQAPEPEPSRPAVAIIPNEIQRLIVQNLVNSLVHEHNVRDYRLGYNAPAQGSILIQLLLVSRAFGRMILDEWNRHWHTFRPAPEWGLSRPVVLFERLMDPLDLSPYSQLQFASLDFQNAFERPDGSWRVNPLVARLPASLKEIEFFRVHASESEVIEVIRRLCPDIVALRIVFCTMFNNPNCVYWSLHQEHALHNCYLKGYDLAGVRDYANSLKALRCLPNLKTLHIGVYFIPLRAVDTHRSAKEHIRYHKVPDTNRWLERMGVRSLAEFQAVWSNRYQNAPMPDIELPCLPSCDFWEAPCRQCTNKWYKTIKRAERLAVSILAAECQTLRAVSFASFMTEKRTFPSEWVVGRLKVSHPHLESTGQASLAVGYPAGTQVGVWTRHMSEPPGSDERLTLGWSGNNWDCVGIRKLFFGHIMPWA